MRRALILLMVCIVLRPVLHAQSYEGKIDYQKTQQAAAIMELPYAEDIVQDAVKEYMAKKGYRGTGSSGFTLYRAAKMDNTDSSSSDLYFKFEHKSRKEKDVTIITLLPTRVNEAILNRSPNDNARLEEAKSFLNSLTPVIDAHNLSVQTQEQEEAVRKAKKKYQGLADDQADLEKHIRKLQADLDQNKLDQQKQANEIQANVNQDQATVQKAHKKMDHLLNEQGDFQKKLRKNQAELDQNKKDQEKQDIEVRKQEEQLDALKAKKSSAS
jgi:DNA repair exonuclease SbcCD ATPase subunit